MTYKQIISIGLDLTYGGGEFEYRMCDKIDKGYTSGRQIYKCNKCILFGNKELWEALIQAKQDLEIALTAIKEIAEECGCLMAALKSTGFESVVETFDKNIRKKLKQIEHKE